MRRRRRARTFWPTAQQELLIDAALGDVQHARAAWRRLRPTFYIDSLDEGSYPLLPLLYRRRDELGLDDPLLPRLKGIYRHTWSRNQVALDDLLSVVRVFRDAGIETVVTGAAAALVRYYPGVGFRPVGELSVTVSPETASRAFHVMGAAGWHRVAPETNALSFGHASFRNTRGFACSVWTRGVAESRPSPAFWPSFFENSVETDVHDVSIRVCDPSDQLSQTLLLGARGHTLRNIQWVVDALMILVRAGTAVDWQRLVRDAQDHHAVTPMREGLTYLQSRFGITVPDEQMNEMANMPISPRDALAYGIGAFGGRAFGEFPGTIAEYIRDTGYERPLHAIVHLPRRLQRAWQLEHVAKVPVVLVAKTVRQAFLPTRRDGR